MLLAGLSGCLPMMNLPRDFIHVEQKDLGDYAIRGVSADGVVVALRSRPNMDNGTLAFWAKAMTNEMTGRGYKLISSEDVTSNSHLPGRMLTFSVHSRGAPFTYMLAVYVRKDAVLIAEVGGRAEAVKAVEADIQESLLTVR